MWYLPMGGYLRAVKIVFGIIVAVSVLALISDLMEVLLLNKMVAGEAVTDQQTDINDARQGIIGLLQLLGLVAGAITFILWLYRAYQNTDAVAPGTRRHRKGWAIGGWFVPILAYWRPKEIINDVWRAGGHGEPARLLAVWWGVWIVAATADRIAGRIFMNAETTEAIRNSSIFFLAVDVLYGAAAVLAIMAAVRLTRRLDERAKAGPPQPATPRFERDEHEPEPEREQEAFTIPERGSVPVPPKFGSGASYR